MTRLVRFNPSLHPRAKDGKFSNGGSTGRVSRLGKVARNVQAVRARSVGFAVNKNGTVRKPSTTTRRADTLRLGISTGLRAKSAYRDLSTASPLFAVSPALGVARGASGALKLGGIANDVHHFNKVYGKHRITDPKLRLKHDQAFARRSKVISRTSTVLGLGQSALKGRKVTAFVTNRANANRARANSGPLGLRAGVKTATPSRRTGVYTITTAKKARR